MIRDLLKGNIRLVVTYWVFGVIPAGLYLIISLIIENYYIKLVQLPHIQWFFYLYILFPFLYFPFIYVAIWRSSNNYTKNKLWPTLAKIAVCVGTAFLIYNASVIVKQWMHRNDISYEISNEVKLIQKSLPLKQNYTQLTNVSFNNNIIFYDYQFINKDKSQINIDEFAKIVNPKLLNLVCSESKLKGYMSKGISITYRYYDQHNVLIYEYTIKSNDCP